MGQGGLNFSSRADTSSLPVSRILPHPRFISGIGVMGGHEEGIAEETRQEGESKAPHSYFQFSFANASHGHLSFTWHLGSPRLQAMCHSALSHRNVLATQSHMKHS